MTLTIYHLDTQIKLSPNYLPVFVRCPESDTWPNHYVYKLILFDRNYMGDSYVNETCNGYNATTSYYVDYYNTDGTLRTTLDQSSNYHLYAPKIRPDYIYQNTAWGNPDNLLTYSFGTLVYSSNSAAYQSTYDTFVTDIPRFDNMISLYNFLDTGDDSGIEKPENDDDNLDSSGNLDINMDIPKIVRISTQDRDQFAFVNACSDYFIEMMGRWYSIDDIELFKENLMWKHRYHTEIKGELSTWVTETDNINSVGKFTFSSLGYASVGDFLLQHPVDSRSITGGTNKLGNYFSGYNDALDMLKLLLVTPCTLDFCPEVYVRYYYIDDNDVKHVSKWCHYYQTLGSSDGTSGSHIDDADNMDDDSQSEDGLTPEELDDLEKSDDSRKDKDTIRIRFDYDSLHNLDDLVSIVNQFISILNSLVKGMGQFPAIFATVFSFFPSWLVNMLSVGIVASILLRFLGR